MTGRVLPNIKAPSVEPPPKARPHVANSDHRRLLFAQNGTNGIATAGNAATGGTGLNLFGNPAQLFADLRPVEISTDTSTFRGLFHGLGAWNTDFSLSKQTTIAEQFRVKLQVDFLNVFNHPNFLTPTVSLFSPASFGVVTTDNSVNAGQNVGLGPRRLQASLRVDF